MRIVALQPKWKIGWVPHPGAATVSGSTFAAAYGEKLRVYGDVAGSGQVALVVVAAEVFGRFCANSRELVADLVRVHCQDAGRVLRRRLELGWHRRWWGLLSVAVQVAVAGSIVPDAPAFEEAEGRLIPRLRSTHDHRSLLEAEHAEYLYLAAVRFVREVKKGPFHEHSPYLNDISQLASWQRVDGLVRMYDGEVLGKLPVVQHLPFGELLKWE